jgi:tetratricopeptide (TPR) repeat protein
MSETVKLTPEERRALDEAEGWLGLGDLKEVGPALARLPPSVAEHPEVLLVRWQFHAAQKDWEPALEIAVSLTRVAPESPFGWVHSSFCLHELKRTQEARDNLITVLGRFPQDPLMRYNLACYECQLGRMEQALDWLQKAFLIGDARKLREMALEDPDLKPLMDKIREM